MNDERRAIVFRADASEEIGGGHVVRCLALAAAFAGLGWRVGFAVNAEALSVVPSLRKSVADVLVVNGTDELPALVERWPGGAELLVVDHYARDAAFERRCRPWAGTILAIDDLADRPHCVDVLMDQTYGREESDYRPLTGQDCRLLLGARFALLRPQFRAERDRALARRANAAPPRRLLISFGATDSTGVTKLALQAAVETSPALSIDVIVGPSEPNLDEIRRMTAFMGPAVTIHRAVSNMAALMTEADFAVGACGTTSWERCCLGLPTLAAVTADNQRLIARNLATAGAIEIAGDAIELTVDALATRLAALRTDASRCRAMAQAAASICDGNGAHRVAAELMKADGPAVG